MKNFKEILNNIAKLLLLSDQSKYVFNIICFSVLCESSFIRTLSECRRQIHCAKCVGESTNADLALEAPNKHKKDE